LAEALSVLRDGGVRSLLVEGGARVITSFLAGGLADRVVVGIAPTIVGSGTEAVGDLHVSRIAHGLRLTDRSVYRADDDLLIAADVGRP
jgi:riboflavin biosynthesis pyrimidine reductase